MNQGPLLFLGIFFSMVLSFGGLILGPHARIGQQGQVPNNATNAIGQLYPYTRAGLAREGADVYRSLGCVECHTRQVRGLGADRERGWGARITVAQDYLGDYPVLLGNLRIGPDLANVALRQPDRKQLYLHLYDPQQVMPGSMMPPYRFLFETKKLLPGQQASDDALAVKVQPGFELIPTHRAHALVAYLQSLEATAPLFEAPFPLPPKPPQAADTNAAPVTATNITNQPQGAPQPAPPQ
jgi:cytochrome c oxidase cbb3-type subunit 2